MIFGFKFCKNFPQRFGKSILSLSIIVCENVKTCFIYEIQAFCDTFLHGGLLDGAFLQSNARSRCWGDAKETGTGDSEEQHRMDHKERC